VNLLLRELQEDIENLRRFAIINSNNDIGQQISRVLDFAEDKLKEERERELKMIESIERTNKAFVTSGIVQIS